MLQLLEIAFVEGTDRVFEQLELNSVNSLVELLPMDFIDSGDIELDNCIKCSLQGNLCPFFPLIEYSNFVV